MILSSVNFLERLVRVWDEDPQISCEERWLKANEFAFANFDFCNNFNRDCFPHLSIFCVPGRLHKTPSPL
jgi:hypothetical protein